MITFRNIYSSLKKAGIIKVRRGSAGAELAMDPSEITIFDIYNAVDPTSLENLIGIHKNPSPKCPVGCKIHDILEEPYNAVREGIKESMSKYTLEDLLLKYNSYES